MTDRSAADREASAAPSAEIPGDASADSNVRTSGETPAGASAGTSATNPTDPDHASGGAEAEAPPPEEPRVVVAGDGVRYTLLGTAHVSRTSAEAVEREIASGRYDAVAIELDPGRHAALTNPERHRDLDLFEVLRQGRAGALAASLALGAFQQRLADQMGIEPGAEMRAAIRVADEHGLPLWLVDRDIGVTLRRVYRNVPWWQRLTLFGGLIASVISSEEITEEEIEALKEGDILEATFTEFAETSARLYEPLIAERDAYMAARLEQERAAAARRGTAPSPAAQLQGASDPEAKQASNGATEPASIDAPSEHAGRPLEVLVVLGAGHLKGVRERLETDSDDDPAARIAALDETPPPSLLRRALPWLIAALIVAGFVVGFVRNPELGVSLLGDWVIINGGLAALGAAAALAHPLTILGSFVAAPITSLNPTIGAGFVAAGLELWLRKPKVGDFEQLRRDVTVVRGWWRNRVARTLLVFVFATLGSALGTYLGGARIFGRLFG